LITDDAGQTYQTIIYAPHGEILTNQFAGNYDERAKFNGGELDAETGNYNIGVRQNDPKLGIWTSTEPKWKDYPQWSGYVSMGNNPISYVDKDGRGIFPTAAELRQAGESVMADPKYKKTVDANGKTTATYCNRGAQAINAMANDKSVQGNANAMGEYLRKPNNATPVSQEFALDLANRGVTVFASYVNPNPKKDKKGNVLKDGNGNIMYQSGHIAIVAPTEKLSYSSVQNGNVVSVFNVGATNGELTLGGAFGAVSVGLFVLNNDLNTINTQIRPIALSEVVVTGQGSLMTPKMPLLPVKPTMINRPELNY
jgi:RHS repeat-associated protein